MEPQKPKPGYFNKKPLLKSISHFRYAIGLQDSCIQTNQAAVLYLDEQANKSSDSEAFVKSLCTRYKISLGTRDLEYLKTIQYKSYILQTYNFVEPFFKELNADYRFYNNFQGDWKVKAGDKNLDPFNQLLENIEKELKSQIHSYPEYHLIDYYRLVRNSIVHLQENEDQYRKTSKYFSDFLIDKVSYFKSNYNVDAPNEPNKISFADFMLYTRAIKYFSKILNDICFPEIDVFVLVSKRDEELQERLLQSRNLNYPGALLKRVNILRGYFKNHFGKSYDELSNEFAKSYLTSENTDSSQYL